jgi:hypothetical protein
LYVVWLPSELDPASPRLPPQMTPLLCSCWSFHEDAASDILLLESQPEDADSVASESGYLCLPGIPPNLQFCDFIATCFGLFHSSLYICSSHQTHLKLQACHPLPTAQFALVAVKEVSLINMEPLHGWRSTRTWTAFLATG